MQTDKSIFVCLFVLVALVKILTALLFCKAQAIRKLSTKSCKIFILHQTANSSKFELHIFTRMCAYVCTSQMYFSMVVTKLNRNPITIAYHGLAYPRIYLYFCIRTLTTKMLVQKYTPMHKYVHLYLHIHTRQVKFTFSLGLLFFVILVFSFFFYFFFPYYYYYFFF